MADFFVFDSFCILGYRLVYWAIDLAALAFRPSCLLVITILFLAGSGVFDWSFWLFKDLDDPVFCLSC